MPSIAIALAKTVAVVVPSPAMSAVCDATSLIICAPILAHLSSNSISLATVTPSFVIRGDPKDFSITTFLPHGPNVFCTTLAKVITPSSNLFLAFSE